MAGELHLASDAEGAHQLVARGRASPRGSLVASLCCVVVMCAGRPPAKEIGSDRGAYQNRATAWGVVNRTEAVGRKRVVEEAREEEEQKTEQKESKKGALADCFI